MTNVDEAKKSVQSFAVNGVLEISGPDICLGHDAVREALTGGLGLPEAERAFLQQLSINNQLLASRPVELFSDTSAMCKGFLFASGPEGFAHWGECSDEMVLLNGNWLILWREIRVRRADSRSPLRFLDTSLRAQRRKAVCSESGFLMCRINSYSNGEHSIASQVVL